MLPSATWTPLGLGWAGLGHPRPVIWGKAAAWNTGTQYTAPPAHCYRATTTTTTTTTKKIPLPRYLSCRPFFFFFFSGERRVGLI